MSARPRRWRRGSRVRATPLFVALVLLPAALPIPRDARAAGAAVRPPTNLALLEASARAAVDSLLEDFPWGEVEAVEIAFATGDPANWFVGDLLAERFVARKVGVRLDAPPRPRAARDTTASGADSSGTAASAPGAAVMGAPQALECRLLQCAVLYPRSWKAHWFGGVRVERAAAVEMTARLSGNPRGEVRWLGRGRDARGDVIDGGDLRLVEGTGYPFEKPVVERRGFGRYVEPLLVGAIVAGLVSLFYTNQR